MFRMSPSASPCPSPVMDFMRMSPCRDNYASLTTSPEPIISKSRLSMTGGFADLRPREIQPSYKKNLRGDLPSSDDSYESNYVITNPLERVKTKRQFVKVPRRALLAVMDHLSPRLSKKLVEAEKKQNKASPNPMWPNVMTTYSRGISATPIQTLVMPKEPSLTALKARAILDERRSVRTAIQMLADQGTFSLPRQYSSDSCSSEDSLGSGRPPSYNHRPCQDSDEEPYLPHTSAFPVNPSLKVPRFYDSDEVSGSSVDDDFLDEPIFEALDMDAVPTIQPEQLTQADIAEVRNVHVTCDYIVLETVPGPGVFV